MKRCIHLVALAALSISSVAPAWGHGIWFAQRAGRLAIVYGEGAEDLDMHKRMNRLGAVVGVDAAGSPIDVKLQPVAPMVFVESGEELAVVSTSMDNGFWSRSPSGKWVGKPRDEVSGAISAGRYLKYATHLNVLPDTAVKPVPGATFQIVPVSGAFPRQKGERLTVQILYEGKPVPGARVWQDMVNDPDSTPVTADAEGKATVEVRNQGLNVIKSEHTTDFADRTKADLTEHVATLSFVLEHAPE